MEEDCWRVRKGVIITSKGKRKMVGDIGIKYENGRWMHKNEIRDIIKGIGKQSKVTSYVIAKRISISSGSCFQKINSIFNQLSQRQRHRNILAENQASRF